jgi:hypothetical protein
MLRWVAILAIATPLALPRAWAQSEAINGTIRGRVSDTTNAALADATIIARHTATGITRTVESSVDGYYVIPNLPLGLYEVTIRKSGFADLRASNVVLEAGSEAVIDGHLQLASVSTTVEVSGGAPVIDPAKVNVGRIIGRAEIDNLPLPSRNPYNFILFQPGVSGHPNPELGIPRTINTNGLMDRINYQMDGMVDSQQDRHGLRLFPISNTYVREVQTVSNSYAPEFGLTSGNIFNVITNSGTNEIHGMFHYLHRWVDATARPILLSPSQPKPELKLNDYATNAGGPLIKSKLFWFAAYEHLERGQPAPVTINPANAAQIGIDPKLLAPAPGTLHGQFFNVRLDWVINSKHTAFVRYNYFKNSFPFNSNGTSTNGGLYALDADSDFKDRAHVVGLQLVSSLTNNLLNEFRFSRPMRSNTHFAGALTGPGPAVQISGVANFNGTIAAGDRFTEKIPNLNENLTWIHGGHSFKFGGSWQENIDLQRDVAYTQYIFATISDYLDAKSGLRPRSYSTLVVNTSGSVPTYTSHFFGFYGQDSWQATPKLMLVYGLRYDKFLPPPADANAPFAGSRRFNSPSANFGPRLGFAYRLGARTIVRGSGGIFYESPVTNTWFNALKNNGASVSSVTIGSSPTSPPFPTILTSVAPPNTPKDVTTVAPGFRNAYAINASLQVSRELSQNDAITVGYIHTGARNLEFLRNINLIASGATLADGRPIYGAGRIDPNFNNIVLQDSGARSSYNAGIVNYTHRLSAGVQLSASYTWSHSISDAPDVNSFEQNLPIEDASNRLRDRGNSSVNRPQSFTVSTVIQPKLNTDNGLLRRVVNNNTLAILANLSSGDPQNITAGTVLNGDQTTKSVARPVFFGRNTVRGPAIYQVDLRYTRAVTKLWERVEPQFIFEVNNVFNHPNVTKLNTTVATSPTGALLQPLPTTFPKDSTVLEGRIVQVGLAVRF